MVSRRVQPKWIAEPISRTDSCRVLKTRGQDWGTIFAMGETTVPRKQPVEYLFPPIQPTGSVPYYRLVLRGCSQPGFQSNELTGLFFLAAVLVVSPLAAAYFLVAAILGPAVRMLLGQRGPDLTMGVPGLNPSLVALSLAAFYRTDWTDIGMWAVLIVSVVVTAVLVRLLTAILPFPILVLPFLVMSWSLYGLSGHLDVLQPSSLETSTVSEFHPVAAVLFSLGQALFSPSMWSGLLFLAGLLSSNWRHAVIAVLGAVVGTLVSYYYRDADPTGVDFGMYGFNGVLTALAVYVLCGGKLRLAILGALVATILTPRVTGGGLEAVSAPMVFTTWLILALGYVERKWFDSKESNTDR